MSNATPGTRYTAGQVGQPGNGSFMIVVLTLDDRRIVDSKFQTYGCPAAVACGTFVTTWADGKSLDDVSSLTEEHVVSSIGQMPLGREHCPGLAVGALKDAVARLAILEAGDRQDAVSK